MSAPDTLADWLAALRASGWKGRKVGREHVGPCPLCGGEDRFHVREGSKAAIVAGCRRGCTFEELARAVFSDRRRGTADDSRSGSVHHGQHSDPAHWREDRRRSRQKPRGSPRTAPEPPDTPSPALTPDEARRDVARLFWDRSVPIPAIPGHPARRWAGRRHLWSPGDRWPDSARWLPPGNGRPGAIVALFAPLPDWIAAPALPAPAGVQLVNVDADGSPATDGGGLGKRSHGRLSGAVCVIGGPLPEAGRVHVCEGLADALAVAAREDGAALACGGTAGLRRLADPLAVIGLPVTVWPDGERAGRIAADELTAALRERGAVVSTAAVPDGEDPASIAGPFNGPPWVAPNPRIDYGRTGNRPDGPR